MNTRRNFLIGITSLFQGLLALKASSFASTINTKKEKSLLIIRKSEERGLADHGWLKSRHTFSFANYYDSNHMGFRELRVINEDRIAGGTGFDTHPHKDMEIISYVVKGSLEHLDSMGTKAIIRPGEVQRMSAGSGIFHSEYNAQKNDETHFFQIWITPNSNGGTPGYGQKSFEKDLNSKKLVLVVSQDSRNGSIGIKQDTDMYISRLKKADHLNFKVREGRGVWIQIVRGQISINGQYLQTGDAASTEVAQELKFSASEDAELILFDIG